MCTDVSAGSQGRALGWSTPRPNTARTTSGWASRTAWLRRLAGLSILGEGGARVEQLLGDSVRHAETITHR